MSLPEADDYFISVPQSSFRTVLVNRVAIYIVVGVPGADLHYEETVVYNNDSIHPAYLIDYAADVDSSGVDNSDAVSSDVDNSDADNSDADFCIMSHEIY
ncbi:PARP catalytic domain-containing protein [Mycena sanguinolenta]|uniref:PARP catalytic domain-containing protein n=1 Tax=Mycena sanguinolenta TaxID=230812 RepID=A0A8H6YCS4_9AGAR|nr:PARP catalytic domain-containing protein [Mycena sanguinolenta]